MNSIVKAGIALGLSVGVWMFVIGATGWYKNPDMAWLFNLGAILIEIGVLIWGLKQTAAAGRRYGGQILAGLSICLVGGLIIVVVSMVFTGVVFTDVFDELEIMMADSMTNQGMSEQQIEDALTMTAFTRTPLAQAIFGLIGTMISGLIISLITAAFVRSKSA